jgi:hypothetical protein
MIEIISESTIRNFIIKTQTSLLSTQFLKIISDALNLHKEHEPIIGIVDKLNPRGVQILILWKIPFNEHTAMLKLHLMSLGQSMTDLFAKMMLTCGIYIGKNEDVVFSSTMTFNEGLSAIEPGKNGLLFDWHYRLIENNYDEIEPIAPDFVKHILDHAEKHLDIPQELIDSLSETTDNDAANSEEEHDSFSS